MTALIYYLLAINCLAFLAIAIDKFKAGSKKAHRTKEKTLLTLAAIGGSAGTLTAMELFHHKTRKYKFNTLIYIFFLIHITITLVLAKQYI